jgi:hypothetical protein
MRKKEGKKINDSKKNGRKMREKGKGSRGGEWRSMKKRSQQ